MFFGEVEGGWVDAVEDYTGEEFLIGEVGVEGFGEVVAVDEPDEDFQELYHNAVGEHLEDLGVDQRPWGHVLIKLDLGQILLLQALEIHRQLLLTGQRHLDQLLVLLDIFNHDHDLLVLSQLLVGFLVDTCLG